MGGVNYLFRKVNLEVADYFPAALAPTLERRKSRIYKQLAA